MWCAKNEKENKGKKEKKRENEPLNHIKFRTQVSLSRGRYTRRLPHEAALIRLSGWTVGVQRVGPSKGEVKAATGAHAEGTLSYFCSPALRLPPSLVSFFSLSYVGSFSSLSSLKVSVLTGEIHTVEFYLALKRDDAVGCLGSDEAVVYPDSGGG